MIEVLRYIRGYLRIRVSGFSPERFINLCGNRGILLSNIVRQGDAYEMDINLNAFWTLRPIVRKTGTRVAVLKRYGLPFFLPKLLKRKMFAGGLVFAVAFWFWSSFFVWDIELAGNSRITEDVFLSFLKEKQVLIGMRKETLDIEELEKEIRRQFPEITWASARLEGTRLKIDIKENDAPILREEEKAEAGHDLLSQYGGTIVSIIVRSGVPMVTAGDEVEEGAVLVEGKVPVYNEDKTVREYIYVDADADILLEHSLVFSEKLPLDHVEKEYTGREKRRYYLRFGDREWKMPQDRPFLVYDSVIRESRSLLFEKLSVPFYTGTYTYREYQNKEYEYKQEEAEALLKEKFLSFLSSLEEKGVQIIEKDVTININGGFWVISGELKVWEPVGKSAATEKTVIGDKEHDG